MWVSSRTLGQEDPLEEEMATNSSILAWGTFMEVQLLNLPSNVWYS